MTDNNLIIVRKECILKTLVKKDLIELYFIISPNFDFIIGSSRQ
jgi:hypothetical protein